MTKEELHNFRNLQARKNMLVSRLDDLILRSASGLGSGVKGSGISKPVEDITEKREKLEPRIKELENRLAECKRYVDRAEERDELIGTMIRLHYIQGKTWTAVAVRAGGNNTKDSVRKMCHRYIEKNP